MPVSPRDFALWASATGNKYPQTVEEKAVAAPHAYNFIKNIGKSSANPPGTRVGGNIVYDQPVSARYADDNSVLQSPTTPDNNVPKVSGTYDPTLTGEHYENTSEDVLEDNHRQNSLLSTLGRAALAAGAVAGGVALLKTPENQQAIQTAAATAKQSAQNISGRVSTFLGGLGTPRGVNPDVIRNSGDVTPPTTGQRYHQEVIPTETQQIQIAKGASTGSPAESTLPPTTESYSVKPVTESDVITSSQTFGPRSEYEGGAAALKSLEQTLPPSEAVKVARVEAAKQDLLAAARQRPSTYQLEIPGSGATLMALRSKDVGVSPQDAGIYQAPETGSTISPSTEQYSLLSQTPDPWTGKYTPTAQALDLGEQTSRLMPSAEPKSVTFAAAEPILHPVRHEKIAAPKLGGKSLVRTGGGGQPSTVSVEREFDPGEFATSGARDVTGAFLKAKVQQLPGARDIEANIATQESQGVAPQGRFSSLASKAEYAPALGDRPASMIDPRIVTAGGQGAAPVSTVEDLGGVVEKFGALTGRSAAEPDPRALTFLKQVTSLHDITQDPAILEAGSKGALPLNVQLPGGETVPTKSFFKPFGAVGAGEGSNLTQVQALEENVIGKQTVLGNVKAGILNQFGLGPTEKITNRMFNALPQSQRKALLNAHSELVDAQTRLTAAKENPLLFSIPENVLEGTKSAPVISQASGEVVGLTAVPEEKAISTPEFYQMRAAGGAGRQEVGGVGRRREALSGKGYTVAEGSPSDVTPVLYQHADSGEILTADDVSLADIAHGAVRPIRGTAVEPQRIMGSGGRSYKGVSANIIDPASFDPAQRQALAEAQPRRVSPEGLIYGEEAMGGKEAEAQRARGAKAISLSGAHPALGTRFSPIPAPAEGSARAQSRELLRQRAEMIRNIMGSRM